MGVHHLYGLRINCWLQSRKSVSILTYLDNVAETNKVLGKADAVWDHKEMRSRLETNRTSHRTMSGYQRLPKHLCYGHVIMLYLFRSHTSPISFSFAYECELLAYTFHIHVLY